MSTLKLKLIDNPDPEKRTIFAKAAGDRSTVFFHGTGPLELICASCLNTLAKGMQAGQLKGIIFLCNACGLYNEIQ